MPAEKRQFSIDEYIALELEADERHEYIDGQIVEMGGGTFNHSLIAANFCGVLGNVLKRTECHVHGSTLRIGIPRDTRFLYPDLCVICGKPQYDRRDPHQHTVINPKVVVEVASPSSDKRDRGEKFTRYRKLESLEEYVLVAEDEARVEAYFRQGDGSWIFSPAAGLESRLRLRSLQIEIALSEIYNGVAFLGDEHIEPI